MFGLSPEELFKVVPAILIGLTVHELSHAWIALRLGDDTPRLMGRLTLNPLKHIDLFGFIMLVVAGFGWAKPVMINRANLKKPVRDDMLIALAGPFSNLACALLLVLLLKGVVALVSFGSRESFQAVTSVFLVFIAINVSLGLFNLLPIPALDGARLVFLAFTMVSRRPVDQRVENLVHTIGFVVLLGLILLVTYRDILRLLGSG